MTLHLRESEGEKSQKKKQKKQQQTTRTTQQSKGQNAVIFKSSSVVGFICAACNYGGNLRFSSRGKKPPEVDGHQLGADGKQPAISTSAGQSS